MIFPIPECSPFNGPGDFKAQMIQYIKRNFSEVLGKDAELLDLPNGLDLIQARYPIQAGTRVGTRSASHTVIHHTPAVEAVQVLEEALV